MAHSVRRVPVSNLGVNAEGNALKALWRQWNRFVAFYEAHIHNGPTNGAASTSGASFGAGALAKIGVKKGRAESLVSPADGTVVVAATGNVGAVAVDTPFGTTLAASEVGLLEAIVHAMNVAAAELEGHVHGGVTAGAGSTGTPTNNTYPAVGMLTDNHGRSPVGALVTAGPAPLVRVNQLPTRREGLLAEAILMLNTMIFVMDEHTHGGIAAGGPNMTGAFGFTPAVHAIADINGRGPDGEVVT